MLFTSIGPLSSLCCFVFIEIIMGTDTLFFICFSSEKRIYSIRKEFAPSGGEFFPYRVDRFSEGTRMGLLNKERICY